MQDREGPPVQETLFVTAFYSDIRNKDPEQRTRKARKVTMYQSNTLIFNVKDQCSDYVWWGSSRESNLISIWDTAAAKCIKTENYLTQLQSWGLAKRPKLNIHHLLLQTEQWGEALAASSCLTARHGIVRRKGGNCRSLYRFLSLDKIDPIRGGD